jgi:hypothetical protein
MGNDLIRRENELQGSRNWLLGSTPDTSLRRTEIEGFCQPSVKAGETLRFHVSANPAGKIRIEVYRMGYYGGCGARHVVTMGSVATEPHAVSHTTSVGMVECDWPVAAAYTVPEEWVSGVYLAKLVREDTAASSFAIFVVRDVRQADLLFKTSDLTWQAYNKWPSANSLYDYGEAKWYCGPRSAISFARPFAKYFQIVDNPGSVGSGEYLLWEFPIDYWLQREGYDVSYISSIDLHSGTADLGRVKTVLSVGHDEYYSAAMFEQLYTAFYAGTINVGFFSGNTAHCLVDLQRIGARSENWMMRRLDIFGRPQSALLHRFPEMQEFPWSAPDESVLLGVRNVAPIVGRGDWLCTDANHWIYEGSEFLPGDGVPGLVGWEFLGQPVENAEVIARGPTSHPRGNGEYSAVLRYGPTQNICFCASTCWWGDALSEPPGYIRPWQFSSLAGPDARIQSVMRNLLHRLTGVNTQTVIV